MILPKPMPTAAVLAATALVPVAALADTPRPGPGAAVMNLLGLDSPQGQELRLLIKQRQADRSDTDRNSADDRGGDDDRSGDDD